MNTPHLYIDTRGRSKGLYRDAPNGARVAFHTDNGVIELEVNPDGRWYVNEGPAANKAGAYTQRASGSLDRPWCITGLELGRRVVQDRYETEDQARKALADIIGPNRSPQHWTIADLQVEHRPANKLTGGEQ